MTGPTDEASGILTWGEKVLGLGNWPNGTFGVKNEVLTQPPPKADLGGGWDRGDPKCLHNEGERTQKSQRGGVMPISEGVRHWGKQLSNAGDTRAEMAQEPSFWVACGSVTQFPLESPVFRIQACLQHAAILMWGGALEIDEEKGGTSHSSGKGQKGGSWPQRGRCDNLRDPLKQEMWSRADYVRVLGIHPKFFNTWNGA